MVPHASEATLNVSTLPLFVYGSLQYGHAAHRRYCRTLVALTPAGLSGRLYQLPAGYPAVEVPAPAILGTASGDPSYDAALATDGDIAKYRLRRPLGDWQWIHGELLLLAHPRRALPPLDRYEDFHPKRGGQYHRVLTQVQTPTATRLAWIYCTRHYPAESTRLRLGRWR